MGLEDLPTEVIGSTIMPMLGLRDAHALGAVASALRSSMDGAPVDLRLGVRRRRWAGRAIQRWARGADFRTRARLSVRGTRAWCVLFQTDVPPPATNLRLLITYVGEIVDHTITVPPHWAGIEEVVCYVEARLGIDTEPTTRGGFRAGEIFFCLPRLRRRATTVCVSVCV